MNQLDWLIKWFCRVLLITVSTAMTYVVVQPSYNLAHWMPHNMMRRMGLNYEQLLWIEQNTDIALHSVGGFVLTLLLHGSKLPGIRPHPSRAVICISILCVVAELVQLAIGRGIDYSDLLLGIFGSFMAYLVVYKNN